MYIYDFLNILNLFFSKSGFRTQTGPIGSKTGPKPDLIFEDFHKLSVEQRIFKIGPFLTELEALK